MYLSVDVRNKTSKYSHLQDADLQCLEKPNEPKGTTTTESMLFNCLDIVTHNEWDEKSALIESMTLDDFDAVEKAPTQSLLGDHELICVCGRINGVCDMCVCHELICGCTWIYNSGLTPLTVWHVNQYRW